MRWVPLAALVLAQIAYPLVSGGARAVVVVVVVVLGFVAAVGHAFATRGVRTGAALVGITTIGGLAVEAVGVATGLPFGSYEYADALGPKLLGVPVVIPLAWTWMAWPAWLAAGRLARHTQWRVLVAGFALAAWDLFLDPQMVNEGYWRWAGTPGIPLTNYLGWLGVAVLMMALLATTVSSEVDDRRDAPMFGLYLWTYASSVLAHAVFLGLPDSALWAGLGMGLVAIPLAVALVRR